MMWTIVVTVLLLIPSCFSAGLVSISRPLEGLEGQPFTVICESSASQIDGSSLRLQFGITPLSSRVTNENSNSTHKEFTLRNLNREDFTDLSGEGDNGMPLVCAFSSEKSDESVVTVIYNDFVALSSGGVVNETFISILAGETVRIPLIISARPADAVITTATGATPPSGIQVVGSELVITNARREFARNYNVTVTNIAGVSSATFYLEVQSESTTMAFFGMNVTTSISTDNLSSNIVTVSPSPSNILVPIIAVLVGVIFCMALLIIGGTVCMIVILKRKRSVVRTENLLQERNINDGYDYINDCNVETVRRGVSNTGGAQTVTKDGIEIVENTAYGTVKEMSH